MRAEPRPNHDAVGIDRLTVPAVSLPGTDSAEEAMLCEYPHGITPSACRIGSVNERHYALRSNASENRPKIRSGIVHDSVECLITVR
jgi:hypothetical protein